MKIFPWQQNFKTKSYNMDNQNFFLLFASFSFFIVFFSYAEFDLDIFYEPPATAQQIGYR